MKRKYLPPSIYYFTVNPSMSLLANSFNGSSLTIDTSSIEDGDGSDAVKANYVNWDDTWE